MRPLAGTFAAALLLVLPVTCAAQTLTIRDLVALTEAGLGDEVLTALIDADGTVFRLTPLDVLDLKKRGLSDVVITKMIKTVRPAPSDPAPARDSRVRRDDPPVVVEQTVVQEVRVEAPARVPEQSREREREYVQVPVYVPVVVPPRAPVKEPEPVYWGFGGQRRPDSWKEAPKAPVKSTKPAGGGGGI